MKHAGVALVGAWVVTAAAYPALLSILVRFRARQHVAAYGPRSHAIKEGTPTMGGVLFIAAGAAAALVADRGRAGFILAFALVAGAAIGLVDDVINSRGSSTFGLGARQKLVLQCVMGILVGVGVYAAGFTHQLGTPKLGGLTIALVAFAVVACANAVNLTDGVDGLAATCAAIAFAALGVIALREHNVAAASFCAALCGGLGGFLLFNWYPARVFMGDTGSLALGSALVCVSAVLHVLWLVPLLGIVFVAEVVSVIINVTAIRRFGRRVFRASPLHHHFEEIGLREQRLVASFGGIALIAALLTLFIAGTG